jgi:predicted unusual protein kinase regulating ubiquinone biosynthesis (AarF/ABC1/UbiB family)
MAPSLAEGVIRAELGQDPERVFLDWNPVPVAAASIGQVHKAVLPDGRIVAVKIQYPGVDKAIKSDLDNAELLYGMFASFALKNMDVKGLVDELRSRMYDELDYTLEARLQAEFAAMYRGHPFVHVPDVVPELSTRRVLVSDWVDGMNWAEFLEQASPEIKQKSAEVLFRFAEGSIWRHGVFNGDPHPGNYRFHSDGSVTFLDFGLVKRWSPGELEELSRILDRVIERDAEGTCEAKVAANFLAANHGLDPHAVWHYVSRPYEPYTVPDFTFSRPWVADTIATMLDLKGEHGDIIRHLNMPSSYVILDRVVWGVSALLGRIGASNGWREMLAEYRQGRPPSTELGRLEEEWRRGRAQSSSSNDFAIR